MKKYFIISMFAVFGIVAVADACPQAIRRERVRIVQPRARVVQRERVVVREKVVVQQQQVQYYSAPVVEQLNSGCSGCQVQEFRSNFIRSH